MGKALLTAVPTLESTVERARTTTVLRGDLGSQGELHDVLKTLEGLGIELLEVRRLTERAAGSFPTGPVSADQDRTAEQ